MSIQPQSAALIIGVAGCSGSGKTTLAAELAHVLGGIHFPLDNYYRDLAHLPPAERAVQNFDDPATIESPLLAAHVAALARGEAIERPLYDFTTHTRLRDRTEPIGPAPVVIVEGIFALHYAELLPLYQLSVYVDAPDHICYQRRLDRDVTQRGRTPESVRAQWEATVRPSGRRWVQPSAANASLIIDGTLELDWKMELVMRRARTSSGGGKPRQNATSRDQQQV
ncbi:MAG TPA: uridine kinase [Terracidiphilus sp.]